MAWINLTPEGDIYPRFPEIAACELLLCEHHVTLGDLTDTFVGSLVLRTEREQLSTVVIGIIGWR